MNCIILVDIQYDFLPGGNLAVQEGDQIIPLVNRLLSHFDLVVATQDWHPAHHKSFAANHPNTEIGQIIDLHGLSQVLWPVHCVQGSHGADFAKELDQAQIHEVFVKGTDPEIDSYSGFFDNGKRKQTGLDDYLTEQGVDEVYVVGLATDYCVKATALDAKGLGFQTSVIADACRGVNLQAGDVDRALAEMEASGISVMQSKDILKKKT